jgi:hypothetical protein
MLDSQEQMYDPQDDGEQVLSKPNYEIFDMSTVRNTYLGAKGLKKEETPKTEGTVKKEGNKVGHTFKTKSFFERLGP